MSRAQPRARRGLPAGGQFQQVERAETSLNLQAEPLATAYVRRHTLETFLERARALHGDRYEYTQVEFNDLMTPVVITCSEHGPFQQKPHHHILGYGCSECGRRRRAGTSDRSAQERGERFVERARKVHDDRYDYSSTDYVTTHQPVLIRCPEHGSFSQTPRAHLKGSGCSDCALRRQSEGRRLTTEQFIEKARATHGERYDYSTSEYVDSETPITIICRDHGPFRQKPLQHANIGQGCRLCQIDGYKLTSERFIERVAGRYEVSYDYSALPRFVLATDRITVLCPAHGPFEAHSRAHLEGRAGCPDCTGSGSRFEREIRRHLDDDGIRFETQWGDPSLRDKGRLRFDFMLPESRTLIEFDGAFHFRAIQMPGQTEADAEHALRETQRRDAIKEKWASSNGLRLIRLSDGRRIKESLIVAKVLGSTDFRNVVEA